MNRLYKRGSYEIYGNGNKAYVVYNKNLPFDEGHTHINNFETAKYIIYLCNTKKIPKHLSLYLYESIIRITDDKVYKNKIINELNRESKKRKR